jgi:hypothetical protein
MLVKLAGLAVRMFGQPTKLSFQIKGINLQSGSQLLCQKISSTVSPQNASIVTMLLDVKQVCSQWWLPVHQANNGA